MYWDTDKHNRSHIFHCSLHHSKPILNLLIKKSPLKHTLTSLTAYCFKALSLNNTVKYYSVRCKQLISITFLSNLPVSCTRGKGNRQRDTGSANAGRKSSRQTGPGGQNHRGLLQDTTPSFPLRAHPWFTQAAQSTADHCWVRLGGSCLIKSRSLIQAWGKRGLLPTLGLETVAWMWSRTWHVLSPGSHLGRGLRQEDYPELWLPAASRCDPSYHTGLLWNLIAARIERELKKKGLSLW